MAKNSYRTIWKHTSTEYQIFMRCAEGLRKIHPDLNGFDINLEDLSYTQSQTAAAFFRYCDEKKYGYFVMGNHCSTYEDMLTVMIHEFAHCLNFIESAYIVGKKGAKGFGHGKAFKKACRQLAAVICSDNEYNMCLISAFDGPLHNPLSQLLCYNNGLLRVFKDASQKCRTEKALNCEYLEVCSLRELLIKGEVTEYNRAYGIDLLSDLSTYVNRDENLYLDKFAERAKEYYDYSDNLRELGLFEKEIR